MTEREITMRAIKIQREADDPHRLLHPEAPGQASGEVYCNVSRRTEGTVRMEGRVCSYCGWVIQP